MQVLGQGVFAAELSSVHNLLLAALFAPGLLGMAPAEADTAKRLAIKAKVRQQLHIRHTKLTVHACQYDQLMQAILSLLPSSIAFVTMDTLRTNHMALYHFSTSSKSCGKQPLHIHATSYKHATWHCTILCTET